MCYVQHVGRPGGVHGAVPGALLSPRGWPWRSVSQTPPLSATYLLHPNRSCWLPPHPPLGVGAGGQGWRQAVGQQQTLGNRGPVGGPLCPPWLRLLQVSPPGVGQWPLCSQGHREPPLQGMGRGQESDVGQVTQCLRASASSSVKWGCNTRRHSKSGSCCLRNYLTQHLKSLLVH